MTIRRRAFVAAAGMTASVGLAGCSALGSGGTNPPAVGGETLTLTTTTSTYDTGLLAELNAPFEDRYGVAIDTVAQGTGAALGTARNGDADVVVVHSRALEDEFLTAGYGVNRRDLMSNDFLVVGPPEDDAGIGGETDVQTALTAISEAESPFVSRGDESGTHTRERELWEAAGLTVDSLGEWYLDGGGGMGDILNQASMQEAYTLSDRGTFVGMRDSLDLEIHVQGPVDGGPADLANAYGIVAVNPAVHDHVNYDLALAYIGFVTSPEAETIIESYTVGGEQLFFPDAITAEPNFEQYVPEERGSNSE